MDSVRTDERTPESRTAASAAPHHPDALRSHDAIPGGLVAVLSVGMFVITPVLAVLRKTGVIGIGWGWVVLPVALCVAAVFLHGVIELARALLHD